MHILIVTQYFWPENFRINDLVQGLLGQGHRVTVLTGIPNYPSGQFFEGYGFFKRLRQNYGGAKIIRVPLIARGKGGGLRLALNYFSFVLSSCLLAPFLVRKRPDVIFVFEPSPITVCLPALILKKLRRVPVLFWVQDLWPESLTAAGSIRSRSILNAVTKLVRFIYQRCDKILVTSQAYVLPITQLGIAKEKIVYFPQSAEELYQPMLPDEQCAEAKLMPQGFRVMFAGNIGAAQDFATLLSAAKILQRYHEIHWVVLGDGRMRAWVEAEVKARGLEKNFHLLGRFPLESMPRFFAFADALLVTLKKDPLFSLTIPAKIQSYLACAKPIIAALDGEGAHIIQEAQAGFTCAAEQPQALADAVFKMYQSSSEERGKLGQNGRAFYLAHFERNMLIQRLESWMYEVAKKG